MNIPQFLILAATALASLSVQAAGFSAIQLESDGSKLKVLRTDGRALSAPKFDNQDGFEKPAISADWRHVGWLALYPDQGASYSQPIELVVLGASNKIRRFAGHFGMVYQWCFSPRSDAVVYRYQFPHGSTPIGFEMRRLSDGKLIQRVKLEPVPPDDDEAAVIHAKAPAWTRCAQRGAAAK
ncbi:hypothetical protein [Paucibacter sp. DJ2R-2]|uniref:hypothetical protein n=1 Tax=Paucibacter sp. DJ2R-2 TaxID=2893558 RepID=UPI0021E43EE9|nr:hypothetical protein [Paucibacter sp. DJ2R-2]